MLNSKVCAPLVFSVILFKVILPCQSQFINFPSGSASQLPMDSYPAMGQFPSGMGTQGGSGQLFMNLLAPIQPPLFPPNLIAIKNKLCELIMSNQLEVGPVLDYLVRFQHLDQFDYMIAALLALRDTLPTDCPLRQELGQLIVHSIFKRCQARIQGGGGGALPPPPPPPPPVQPARLNCEIIINMLNYFQSLLEQYNCQQCMNGGGMPFRQFKRNSQQVTQVNRRRSVNLSRNNLVLQQGLYANSNHIPYEQLIAMIPQPQNEMERTKYTIVTNFLRSSEITQYLKGLTTSDYSNKQTLLNLVLRKVSESSVTTSVKEAFSYYLQAKTVNVRSENSIFDYSTLVDLIPQPLDAEEKAKFEIVKTFLSSKEVHKYLKNIEASVYTNRKLLFKTVLKTLAASKLDASTVEAFLYYSNYQESLTELELYTKKEITRHFELTKIFIDTLDIDSLSNEAKLSFKKFFKFISNVTKDQIKDFDSWSEVKTKGEFMKAFFKYLLSQPFVPQDIKEAILQLEPLVKMVGRGAAPP